MYKLLLCWRYLLTRYLALVCIISVMLGVGTLIVVNSVMAGFSTKLKQRLHGLLSDVVVESFELDGFSDPNGKMEHIWNSPIGSKIEAMTATIETLGLIRFNYGGRELPPRTVRLVGVDARSRARIGGFAEHLWSARNQQNPSFELSPEAQRWHEQHYAAPAPLPEFNPPPAPGVLPRPEIPPLEIEPPAGIFLGYALGHFRRTLPDGTTEEIPVLRPGDEVIIITSSGQVLKPVYESAVVADYFKSEMSEYDASYVFVPLEWFQTLRTMQNRATHLQIKLKNYGDAPQVVDALKVMFPDQLNFGVQTWEEKQGALLAAISVEKGLLNVLLFLIIGVAGFGILAIFAMIVVEKTRDIGILKALGASNGGVMKIFLGYGLLLGVVGALLGTILGVGLTVNINEIEHWLTSLTGQEIFPRGIYYFDKIPTDIQGWTVFLVNAGAVAIAVLFSVLPALRAALLHPVRALRYE
jgi:lipoprotein-releasing system permease protein